MELLQYDFMRRALLAGVLVGLAGPAVGLFIVQRRLSLMGDGIGHVAFAGVAAGLLAGVSPVLFALGFAITGAVAIEALRGRWGAAGDVALALVFYGGIAGGVLLLGLGDISTLALNSYLFGSVLTVSSFDLLVVAGVALSVLGVTFILRRPLFAAAYDEEVARVTGLPVTSLNLTVAVLAAVAIAATAKVVGILLVSSMLVLPVAAAQQWARSFKTTALAGLGLGVFMSAGGLVIALYADLFPAATIVLLGIFVYAAAALWGRWRMAG